MDNSMVAVFEEMVTKLFKKSTVPKIRECFTSLHVPRSTKCPYVCVLQEAFFLNLIGNGVITLAQYPNQRNFKVNVLDKLGAGCCKEKTHFPGGINTRQSFQIPRANFSSAFCAMLDRCDGRNLAKLRKKEKEPGLAAVATNLSSPTVLLEQSFSLEAKTKRTLPETPPSSPTQSDNHDLDGLLTPLSEPTMQQVAPSPPPNKASLLVAANLDNLDLDGLLSPISKSAMQQVAPSPQPSGVLLPVAILAATDPSPNLPPLRKANCPCRPALKGPTKHAIVKYKPVGGLVVAVLAKKCGRALDGTHGKVYYLVRLKNRKEPFWVDHQRLNQKKDHIKEVEEFEQWLQENEACRSDTDNMLSEIYDEEKTTLDPSSVVLSPEASSHKLVDAFHGFRYHNGRVTHYFASWTDESRMAWITKEQAGPDFALRRLCLQLKLPQHTTPVDNEDCLTVAAQKEIIANWFYHRWQNEMIDEGPDTEEAIEEERGYRTWDLKFKEALRDEKEAICDKKVWNIYIGKPNKKSCQCNCKLPEYDL